MDQIFLKSTSIFNVVDVARKEPRRFGKRGELLVEYAEHEVGIATISLNGDEAEGEGVIEINDEEEGRGRDGRARGTKEE